MPCPLRALRLHRMTLSLFLSQCLLPCLLHAAQQSPPVAWSSPSTTATVSPGNTETLSLTFVTTEDIDGAVVALSPQLLPLVSVRPILFLNLKKGDTRTVTLEIALRKKAILGTYTGQLILIAAVPGSNHHELFIQDPTALNINVWEQTTEPVSGVQLQIPPWGTVQAVQRSSTTNESVLDIQVKSGSTFLTECSIGLFHNPGMDLTQWFETVIDSNGILTANSTFAPQTLQGGIEALVFSSPVPQEYGEARGLVSEAYAQLSNGDIVSITESGDNNLLSAGYSQTQIDAQLVQILGTIQAQ